MGWLELLPLLRRLLPLLDRAAPMLESLVAGRMGGRAALEANATSLAELAKNDVSLKSALEEQRLASAAINAHIEELQGTCEELRVQLSRISLQSSGLTKTFRIFSILVVLLLLLCIALLTALLLRHA